MKASVELAGFEMAGVKVLLRAFHCQCLTVVCVPPSYWCNGFPQCYLLTMIERMVLITPSCSSTRVERLFPISLRRHSMYY